MFKKAFRFIVPCVGAALALLFLPNGPLFGLILGEPSQPQQRQAQAGRAAAAPAPAADAPARKTVEIRRAPSRVIKDPNSSFSAVAVDVARNEVVLQDENLAQIMVYSRQENTPPKASRSEPKRIIGGNATKVAMNCGVYVDPASGDIYSVNGDTSDWVTIFSREVKGNSPPTRDLAAPHRAFGVIVDEEAKELFITIQHPPAVVVWPKEAKGNDAPVRILEGERTQLHEAQGIAIDTKNQLLYVSNQGAWAKNNDDLGWSRALKPGSTTWEIPDRILDLIPGSGHFYPASITVYPLKAGGDTAPVRVITGPKTRLNWPGHIALDVERQELYEANPVTHEILVFRATDSGDVAPIRVLKGNKTNLSHPYGVFVDTKNDELFVANFGNHSSTVYKRDAAGDTAPIRTIRSAPENAPAPIFGNIGSITYDTKRSQFLIFNCVAYPHIAAFARLADGNVSAVRSIAGQATKIGRASHDVFYDEKNDEIVVASANGQAVVVLPGNGDGDAPALRMIQGPHTQIQSPGYGVAVDSVHDELWVVEGRDRPGEEYILVFPRTANGDVAPLRVIKGPDTRLKNARNIIVDPTRNLIAVGTNNGTLVFNRTDNGNVKPRGVIRGPGGNFRLIESKGWIVAANGGGGGDEEDAPGPAAAPRGGGNEARGGTGGGRNGGISVWSITDNGNIPPLFRLVNPNGNIGGGRVALNPKQKEVIIGGRLSVTIYSFPEIFN